MREAPNQRAIWAAAAALAGTILFRANSGKAWLSGAGPAQRLADGGVVVPAARPVALGLALASGDSVPGQSDLIGWHTITIRPEWVGRRVAVFLAIECKRPTKGRATEDQLAFVANVRRAGGIAGIAETPAVAQALLRDWEPPE